MPFKFENLQVWQKAIHLSLKIHELTRNFPKEETYILTAQIKRAADSIALNVAEGSTGQSNAEFAKFVSYAIRSAIEVVTCLHLGRSRNLIIKETFEELYCSMQDIIRMLQALRKSLL